MASDDELGRESFEDSYPLTPMQEGLLVESLTAAAADPNLTQIIAHCREHINPVQFERAWTAVVQRHDTLRTSFQVGSAPMQRGHASVRVPCEHHDLSQTPAQEQAGAIERLAEAQLQPFDLGVAPLMRLALAQCGPQDFQFIWTFHHAILDAQSFVVILREVFAAYEALCRGGAPAFETDAPKYRAFVEHVRSRATNDDYWKKAFENFETPTRLGESSEVAAARSRVVSLELSETATVELRRFTTAQKLTVTTAVQGAWALLLSRYTGEEDVAFGVVRGGRHGVPNGNAMAGLLITTLPMRVKVQGDSSVAEWLRELRQVWRGLREHEHVSLAEIHRHAGKTALFETLVSVQDPPWDEALRAQGGEWERRSFEIRNGTSYPASLDVAAGRQLRLTLNYTKLADSLARRLLEHLQIVLKGFVARPQGRVTDVPMLTSAESFLLRQWNTTKAELDLSQCVHELVAEQAEQNPDAIAVRQGCEEITYGVLNDRANRLAAALVDAGVGPDVLAGVYMGRSVDLVVAFLAVLKAGGAYVPIDPTYPESRIEFVLRDAKAPVLVTHRKLAKGLELGETRVIYTDGLVAGSGAAPPQRAKPEHLAYVIYTSGSTGKPKGVAIEHRSLLNLVQWHRGAYGVTPADRATQVASPAFDAAVWEIWPPLVSGASLHIPDEETRMSPAKLVQWLHEERITMAFLPTPLAEAAMDEPWPAESALRYLFTGGDQLRKRPSSTSPFVLVNHYGPTENTVVSTAGTVSPGVLGVPTIGRPISNVQVEIVDRHLQPVPIGVPGELCVSGAHLARGYWNQPALTAERFVTRANGQRLYCTGDLVRFREDGEIEFMGRLDHQVKVRGYRVETGEIECELRRHSGVADAAVVTQTDGASAVHLVAYLVLRGDTSDVREFLRDSLPDYMVPDVFVPLQTMPMTPHGKLDRKALPVVEFAAAAPRYTAPRNAGEDVLAGIWCDVLKQQRVGIDDNFFSLGGHSLSATQVITRARAALGMDLPLNALFQSPTIRQLAEKPGNSKRKGPQIEAQAVLDEVPLSFAQERLWFFEQLDPGKPVNNIGFCLEVVGPLNVAALEAAATEVVRRHASLRTVFLKRDGRPSGRVLPAQEVKVTISDLTQFPESERERAASRMAEAAARDVFDLSSGPLLKLHLLQLAPERQWLVITMHHIASDGWSMAILYRELAALYTASTGAKALPPLKVQYHDYARWQREQGIEADLNYWRQKLGGKLPVLDLPADRPRPAVQTYNGAIVPVQLPPALTRRLEAVARREDVTLYMLLLAGFKAVLHRYSGQEDIIVGSPVAGRTQPETESLIGMFVNMLAMRNTLSQETSFRDLLQQVRTTALEAYAHQQLPFEKLVDALQLERDLSRSPLFQVMFVLQNAPAEAPAFAGTEVTAREIHTGTAKYDLTLSLENTADGLSGFVEFNSDLFDAATVQRFCGHFETLLSGVAEDTEQCLGKLPLLTPPEREQILVTWNATERPFAADKTVHQLFEEQVERTPDTIAAVFEDTEISYRELNRRANAVAARLRALRVGPEARVGICIGRSLEMLAGLLGILKSGAAYVPLDPAYPRERLALMVEDAQVHALLTEKALAAGFSNAQAKLLCIEDIQEVEGGENVRSGATPDNLAYVIYTSGSTGKPKGVMIRHRNISNFFTGMDEVLGRDPGVWLAVTSICFDISVLELLWTTSRGFKVVIQSDEGGLRAGAHRGSRLIGYTIPEQIRRQRVTHFQCTPSLMGMLLQEPGARDALAGLDAVLLGGEALTSALLQQLTGPRRIINMYGPTETTVWSTSRVVEPSGVITIGRPLANTSIYILDRFQQPAPVGVPGELLIGGAGVVRGYLNRPELTAERFVPNPFARQRGERIYRTGDLAKYKADGTIEFLGRLDHQVKLRGFRIELGEIEAALRQIAGIREAVVVVRELSASDKRLAAYLVAEQTMEPAHLRRALKERLPDYMVPSLFTFLPKLPLTPNGKIDRKALPEPDGLRAAAAVAFTPAQSDTERKIADIWRDLLRIEQVGVNDNFFDLGGHSLLMVQAQARIASAFGRELPVVQLFQYPTVGSLAKVLGEVPRERMAFDKIRERARLQRQAFAWRSATEVMTA